MKYYDKNDIDLYDFVPPLQYEGATAVHGDLDNFFNNAKDVKGNFVVLVVETGGTMGMARSIQHFTWTDAAGKPQEATLRVTDVFRKEDGKWKVIDLHVSVPGRSKDRTGPDEPVVIGGDALSPGFCGRESGRDSTPPAASNRGDREARARGRGRPAARGFPWVRLMFS